MAVSEGKLVIATRKSPLALKQAHWVADLVVDKMGYEVELLPMSTTGDRQSEWSLQEKGGKGGMHICKCITPPLQSHHLRSPSLCVLGVCECADSIGCTPCQGKSARWYQEEEGGR